MHIVTEVINSHVVYQEAFTSKEDALLKYISLVDVRDLQKHWQKVPKNDGIPSVSRNSVFFKGLVNKTSTASINLQEIPIIN